MSIFETILNIIAQYFAPAKRMQAGDGVIDCAIIGLNECHPELG